MFVLSCTNHVEVKIRKFETLKSDLNRFRLLTGSLNIFSWGNHKNFLLGSEEATAWHKIIMIQREHQLLNRLRTMFCKYKALKMIVSLTLLTT